VAKAPKKPASSRTPKKAKPNTRKGTQSEEAQAQDEQNEEFYQAHKEVIDRELRRCTAHLKKLDDPVALAVISRLKAYFIKKVIGTRRVPSMF
jgi:hypothetical protein